MITETDGIILRQTKTANDRSVLVLLTRKLGKISAGAGRQTGGRRKSSLPLRAFTHGRYQLYHGKSMYNIDSADTIESFYRIGENPDSFFTASCALEFTDRLLPEQIPAEPVLDTLIGMLRILSVRKSKFRSLLIMYQWKLLQLAGYLPELHRCVRCGAEEEPGGLSVADGGILCRECCERGNVNMRLLYKPEFDIIQILKFIEKSNISTFSNLAFNDSTARYLDSLLKSYLSYHLDIGELKSSSYVAFD